jgi:transcriptional regulator with XRE-family HTH domain
MGTPSGSPLPAARLSAGLSQEELAERSGLSVRNISNIERGRVARPRRGSLDALADALSLQPQERTVLIEHYRGGGPTALVPLVNRNFLPRATAGFTGRASEIATVLELIDGVEGAVCGIDGMAGAGKTAFAVHLAHEVTSRFPDGRLFVDLRGSTPGERPLEPEAALVLLLRQIGVPGEHIPIDPLHRAALWRQETAGLRALVVLDNAAADDQVRSLLPHTGACLTLITSRRRQRYRRPSGTSNWSTPVPRSSSRSTSRSREGGRHLRQGASGSPAPAGRRGTAPR